MELWITVEEAAALSGKSDQTIRRWCRDQKVVATKSGRDWLIDPQSLPTPKKRRTTASPSGLNLVEAWRHLAAHDLKQDTWVPDPLGFADFLNSPDEVIDEARQELAGRYQPDILDRIAVPKTDLLNRNAAMPSLRDRVVYQAVVASFADRIEDQLTPSVYSARLSKNSGKFFLEKSTEAHGRFQERTRQAVEDGYEFLVIADIASYFDNIQHRLLFAQIQGLNPDPESARVLGNLLSHWDLGGGAGIPQGPNASRVLGNLYLQPVDLAVLNSGMDVVYLRFQDDIRIAARTRADAVKAFHLVERELRRLALTPVARKTYLVTSQSEVDRLLGDPGKDGIASMMDLGLIEAPRKELRKMLDKALRSPERTGSDLRFSLWRLARLRDSGRLTKVLNRLDELPPYASLVAAFVLPFVSKARTQRKIGDFLRDPARNLAPFMAIWLLAAVLEAPRLNPDIVSYARDVARDRNSHKYLRPIAAMVVARHGNLADIQWLEGSLLREHDPYLARGFLVALRHTGKLKKNLVGQVAARHPELESTATYLNGRNQLPSLVYAGRTVRVP